MKPTARCILGAMFTLITSPAFAGGGFVCGGCATEVTQILNNVELVSKVQQQVKTVDQLVQTYKVQYSQLQELMAAGKQIAGVNLGDILSITRDLNAYQGVLRGLHADLGSMQSVFDTRMAEAKLLNLSAEDYFAREANKIQNKNMVAKARLANEAQVVNQVNQDITLAETYSKRIASTEGVHQSSQLLNYQMNLMAQQLTRLVQMTAQQQGSDLADKESEAASKHESALLINQSIGSVQKTLDQRNGAMLNSLPPRGK